MLVLQLPANRDPRRWEDPDRFYITRRSAGHVGLGYGIHACVGQAVARIEGASLVTELARRVERIELLGAAVYKLNQGVHAIDPPTGPTHAGLDPPVPPVGDRVRREADEAGGDDPEEDRPVGGLAELGQRAVQPHRLVGVVLDRRADEEPPDEREDDRAGDVPGHADRRERLADLGKLISSVLEYSRNFFLTPWAPGRARRR